MTVLGIIYEERPVHFSHAGIPRGNDIVTIKEEKNVLRNRMRGVDADLLPSATAFELHDPCNTSEEGVVFAEAHVETGKELRSPLTDQNRSGLYGLSAIGLNPKVLRIAIAPVSRRSATFICCHD